MYYEVNLLLFEVVGGTAGQNAGQRRDLIQMLQLYIYLFY